VIAIAATIHKATVRIVYRYPLKKTKPIIRYS